MDKIKRLQALPWDKVQLSGIIFADALEHDTINPTEEELANLIQLTAKLLAFVAEVKEVVYDDDNVSYAS